MLPPCQVSPSFLFRFKEIIYQVRNTPRLPVGALSFRTAVQRSHQTSAGATNYQDYNLFTPPCPGRTTQERPPGGLTSPVHSQGVALHLSGRYRDSQSSNSGSVWDTRSTSTAGSRFQRWSPDGVLSTRSYAITPYSVVEPRRLQPGDTLLLAGRASGGVTLHYRLTWPVPAVTGL